jgi:uncharacterized protein with von Willebrand factor type A (vWA) domain
MKSILKKNPITKEREAELVQDLYWIFTEERIRTTKEEEKHELFEEFLTLLNQLIDSETRRIRKHDKRVQFDLKTQVRRFEKDNNETFDYTLNSPTSYHPSKHNIDPYY